MTSKKCDVVSRCIAVDVSTMSSLHSMKIDSETVERVRVLHTLVC